MKPDIPLLNQSSRNRLLTLEYFRFEAELALKNHLRLEALMRVAALRKSCGATSPESTVSVRLPPRYL